MKFKKQQITWENRMIAVLLQYFWAKLCNVHMSMGARLNEVEKKSLLQLDLFDCIRHVVARCPFSFACETYKL